VNTAWLAVRLLRREWRAGELRVLALAVVVAVGSVTTVGFFTDRVNAALGQQAGQLLGADLVLSADHPPPRVFSDEARRRGLRIGETLAFPSMVARRGRIQLADIVAAGPGYPLRGRVRIRGDGGEKLLRGIPPPGTVWAAPRLLERLGAKVGGALKIGSARLTVGARLLEEPGSAGRWFHIAPRLLMNLSDLSGTGLVRPGSRISYRLLVAGSARQIAGYRRWAQTRLGRGERLEGVEDARPEVRAALARARQFLGLAALVAAILASVAVALAIRRFLERHWDACAMMRCLGASQSLILRLYLDQLLLLGLLACAVGCGVGLVAQQVLAERLGVLVAAALPWPGAMPALQGGLIGMALLMGFAWPPLRRLREAPTLQVLRREGGAPRAAGVAAYLLGAMVLAALLVWQAGEIKLGLIVVAGLAGGMAFAGTVAWGMIVLLRRWGRGRALRFGVAGLHRRAASSVWQIVAFSVGIMALLVLTLVRGHLVHGWQATLPPDTPNRFVINIQPDQREPLRQFFTRRGMTAPSLYPMVRGRLVAINGHPVRPADYPDARARRLAARAFNLSWARRLRPDNRLKAGQWWREKDLNQPLLSVEAGIARTLGIHLGDRLRYRVAGATFTARVANLRKVHWDSFQVNFFVIGTPGLLQNYPASYVTSFYVSPGRDRLLNALVGAFPNFTVIDVGAVMAEVRRIMERVSLAVEFVFLFTVAAGFVVLYAAIAATREERLRDAALLRVLGASRWQLLAGQGTEFAVIGVAAGMLAATAATALGYVLSVHVFHLPYAPDPRLWLVAPAGGGIGVTVAGLLGTRRLLRRPPLESLRRLA